MSYDHYQPGRVYPMKRRKWPIVVGLLVSALIVATCSWAYNVTTDTPLVDKPAPATSANANDLGAGTPGAGCATNRLGKTFEQDGRTYVCSGPKPYTWKERP